MATADQVADALAGRYGPVSLRFRYEQCTLSNTLLNDISAAVHEAGRMTLDNHRAVRRDLQVTLNEAELPPTFNPSNDTVRVRVEVYIAATREWVSQQMGLFVLDISEHEHHEQHPHRLICLGSDLTIRLMRNIRTAPYSIAAGTNYITAVQAVLTNAGVQHSLPSTAHTVPNVLVWGPGATDWDITRDLLFGINFYPLYVDANGVFRTRERIDPSTEGATVTYKDTSEPRMIFGEEPFRHVSDRKQPNRCVVVIDDPRHTNFGFVQRENADLASENSTASLVYGTAKPITSSSVANPTTITATGHGLETGVAVLISGHTGSTPSINGSHVITKTGNDTFTIPVNVTVGGTGGTVQPTTVQMLVINGDSDPPTKAMVNNTVSAAVAVYEVQRASAIATGAELITFFDPRREAQEFYRLDIEDTESSTLWLVKDWSVDLEVGARMTHHIGKASAVTVTTPP